jgi:hypothetical protein
LKLPLSCEIYGQEEKRKMDDIGCRLVAREHNDKGVTGNFFFAQAFTLRGSLTLCFGMLCIVRGFDEWGYFCQYLDFSGKAAILPIRSVASCSKPSLL